MFKVGDKLKALYHHKDEYGFKYVTITSINMENKVYHWEAPSPIIGPGKMHSGYFFNEAEKYEE
jgi:hypothetical protein